MNRMAALTLLATSALLPAALLSGCFGLMVEATTDATIDKPVPVKGNRLFQVHRSEDRWACRAEEGLNLPAQQSDYLEAWGEPASKSATPNGEVWSYEGRQWCGLWVLFGVPVPLMLPVCKTFDHVEFEGGVSVRADSRRVVAWGGGIAIVPNQVFPLPMPYRIKPGPVTGSRPESLWLDGEKERPCYLGAK